MIETGILFNNIHSFFDLDLILSKVEIAPAEPKTNYIDIPGGDGSLDLTEATGEVKYKDRVHLFTLTMNPAHDLSERAWEEKKTAISNLLNGRAYKVTLDKDPDYYWTGRLAVDSYRSEKRLRQFVISATVRPYKLKQAETEVSVSLTGTAKTVTIRNARKTVCPVIECTNNTTKITFGNTVATMDAGSHQFPEILFVEGENEVTISGSGTVTFRFQEGDL